MKILKFVGAGVGLGSLLVMLVIGLKLVGVVTWPWWLVLSPIFVPVLATLIIVVILFVYWVLNGNKRKGNWQL